MWRIIFNELYSIIFNELYFIMQSLITFLYLKTFEKLLEIIEYNSAFTLNYAYSSENFFDFIKSATFEENVFRIFKKS
jgi:hypothetical protein